MHLRTNVTYCVGEEHYEHAPDGGVDQKTEDEKVIDAGPAGHQPGQNGNIRRWSDSFDLTLAKLLFKATMRRDNGVVRDPSA